jgi:hypothetical protein
MDDVLKDAGIAAWRDAVEKRPTGNAYAVCDVVLAQKCRGAINHLRQVVENTVRTGCGGQDGSQQSAVSAADVDNR